MAKFHHYSANNILLISMQMPEATHVASYTNWQKKFNRQVKRGQGSPLLHPPLTRRKRNARSRIPAGKPVPTGTGTRSEEVEITVPLKVAKVFDASQTAGEPLPELNVPDWKECRKLRTFMDALRSASPARSVLTRLREGKAAMTTGQRRL